MKLFIFGINEAADKFIASKEQHVIMFLDNDSRRCRDGYNGYSVIHPVELKRYEYDAIIITDTGKDGIYYTYEKIEQLKLYETNENKVFVFINNELVKLQTFIFKTSMRKSLQYEQIFRTVHPKSILNTHSSYVLERCQTRKLCVYGIGYEAACLTKMLITMGMQVYKYINDEHEGGIFNNTPIISLIDLVYEEDDSFFVIIADESESYGISRKKFIDMGFCEDVDFTYHSEIPGTNESFYYDVTLSYSRVRDTIEGFEIFGDTHNPKAVNIVVLGGSTTESQLFFVKGWVPFFSEYLHNKGISAKVYCGGISGYTSSQELLKFERDVLPLAPDLVICYSGVNDLYMYPSEKDKDRYKKPFITKFQVQFIHQILEKLNVLKLGLPNPDVPEWETGGKDTVFYGMQNEKSAAQFWIDNMRMIHALSQEFGIAFLALFQPFRFNGYYHSTPTQEIIHSRRDPSCNPPTQGEKTYGRTKEVQEIRHALKKYSYIKDLSKIFNEEANVYYDSVHVYEKGNKVIAHRVCDIVIDYIQPKGEKNNDK